jgi:small GTP-binding protein
MEKNIKNENDEIDTIYYRYKKVNIIGVSEVGKKTLLKELEKYNNPHFEKIQKKDEQIEELKKEEKDINLNLTINIKKIDIPLIQNNSKLHLNVYLSNLDNKSIIENNKESLLYESELIIFILDVTNNNSLKEIESLIEFLISNNSKKQIYKFLILSNKIDLYSQRDVGSYEINELIEKYKNIYQLEISLKTNENFDNLINLLNEILYKNKEFNPNDLIKPQNPPIISNKLSTFSGIINIILLGNSTVGKTSFIRRFFTNSFYENTLITLGIDVEKTLIKFPNKYYKLEVWDTAGQEKFRTIPKKYYSKGDGFFILFDLCNQESFIEVNKWIEDIRETLGDNENNEYKNIPIYLLGNKIDKIKRVVKRSDAEQFAEKNKVKYVEISCKLGFNIYEVMINMIFDASQKIGDMDTFFLEYIKKNNDISMENNKKCCS